MSSTTDKIKGMADQAAGAVKQGVGKAVGNPKLEAEGAIQKSAGKVEVGVGKAKDGVKKFIDKV